jgi:hypothetical protein
MEKQEEFAPGVYKISNARYHASIGLSRSRLWTFKQLPHKYWYQYLSGQVDEQAEKETEAVLIGNLVHTLVLEPELYDKNYFVMPKVNRTTKAGKAAFEEALLEASGRTLINQAQLDSALGMRDAVLREPIVEDVLRGAKNETSIFWRDEQTGILCKARPDIWNHPIVADLKTTLEAGYRSFQATAFREGYFLQAAMLYEACKSQGLPFDEFIFLCVEKKKPYSTGIYRLDDEALQYGLDLFHNLLARFARCEEKQEWPAYGIQTITVPRYGILELGHEE